MRLTIFLWRQFKKEFLGGNNEIICIPWYLGILFCCHLPTQYYTTVILRWEAMREIKLTFFYLGENLKKNAVCWEDILKILRISGNFRYIKQLLIFAGRPRQKVAASSLLTLWKKIVICWTEENRNSLHFRFLYNETVNLT